MNRFGALALLFACASSVAADERLESLCEKVGPSVVNVVCDNGASGSGFIVAADLVATNYHVIEGCRSALVKFQGEALATVVGVVHLDDAKDIAVLKVKTRPELMKPLKLSNKIPNQGQDVAAFGNPQGLEFSVTRGIVSAVRTSDYLNKLFPDTKLNGNWIQTDAAISKGNSGGPLVNYEGEVIGMSTFYHTGGQNLNFAVSSIDLTAALIAANSAELLSFQDAFQEHAGTEASSPVTGGDQASPILEALRAQVLHTIKASLPRLSARQLSALAGGDLTSAFDPIDPSGIKELQVVRLKASFTVIQILEDGMLVKHGSTKCFITLWDSKGAELRAKLGDDIISNVPLDSVFFVGKATAYTTVAGDTSYYMPLIPAAPVLNAHDVNKLVANERASRDSKELARIKAAEENKRRQLLGKYQRTFTDSTGSFRVDAVIIRVSDESATLVRVDTRQAVEILLSRLGKDDREWIETNRRFINFYGAELKEYMAQLPHQE